jgi:hypothetical protein
VEKELTEKETEPSELIYFKVYKGRIPVIEQAQGRDDNHDKLDLGRLKFKRGL